MADDADAAGVEGDQLNKKTEAVMELVIDTLTGQNPLADDATRLLVSKLTEEQLASLPLAIRATAKKILSEGYVSESDEAAMTKVYEAELEAANSQILDKYGDWIPDAVETDDASSLLNVQAPKEFADEFEPRYPDDDAPVAYYHQSPAGGPGEIYLDYKKSANYPEVTGHELTHHYTHPEFRNQLYSHQETVGMTGFHEGVTQYFARETGGFVSKAYAEELKQAERVVEIVGEDTLAAAYFGGDQQAIDDVKAALDTIAAKP